jgi:predicted Abi (CAAX) family protease
MPLPRPLADSLAAIRTLPGLDGWRRTLIEIAWAIPSLLIVAHLGGLLRPGIAADATTALTLAATLFVVPALGEEVLFRALLIPRARPTALSIAIATLLFILWHPLQAVTIGPPWAPAFLDPWFLACVGLLGLACGRIYAATGSLWPPVLLHWLVVFGWKTFLGGPF